MDKPNFKKNGNGRRPDDLVDRAGRSEPATETESRDELGRVFFSPAWSTAANEGLISDEEYVAELLRHVRAENARTIPGIPWPRALGNKRIGTR